MTLSATAWFLSLMEFIHGDSPAVILIVIPTPSPKAINSPFKNSPPLSAKKPSEGFPGPKPLLVIQMSCMAFIIVSGSLFLITFPAVRRENSSIKYIMYLPFLSFRSKVTTSLTSVALGRVVFGRGGVFLNLRQISQFSDTFHIISLVSFSS